MTLSKSNYLLFLKHPAWLWLEKNNKKILPDVDEATQAIFDSGNLFEEYAEKLFPNGKKLGYHTNGEFDFKKYLALPKLTQKALDTDTKVIFQGRLETNDTTCIFDILEQNKDGTYNLYEIKSSTSAKKEHEHDLAFQIIVLEKSGLKIKDIFVIHVNNEYVRDGEINSNELTTTTEITSAVKNRIDETTLNIQKAKVVMESSEMPDPSPSLAGSGALKDWLVIYKILNPDLDKYSIYNLYSPGAKRLGKLEDGEITTINDIPEETNLTARQHHQVQATKLDKEVINKKEIADFLKTFQFPLYFLDYETIAGVLPAYDGMKPYQQVAFQYSVHILETSESELKHKEYLHTKNSLPTKDLIENLKKDIGNSGTVITWNQVFEKGCNDTMAEFLPEHKEFLENLNERVVDLMIPFKKGWYAHKDFFGSASIKAIMPVLIPKLNYKDLTISDGGAAQRIWMKTVIEDENKTEKDKIMKDLIEYCTLDTLAMVEIWKVLKDI